MATNESHLARVPDIGKPRVVIIGGGFGGVELAKKLRNVDVQVVLIDKNNYHTFQPLLYQVGTAALESTSIIAPFRKFLGRQNNFYFRLGEVISVDPDRNHLDTSIGGIDYDYLVVATGATTNFYGMKDIEENAVPLKSIEDAIRLRNKILNNFEKALLVEDPQLLESLMDFVIVGGGPTGVEVAGALSELRKHVFPKDYKELNLFNMDIHLIESSPRLLNGMSEEASEKALQYLKDFGVKVQLGVSVKSYDNQTVTLSTGETIKSKTLIWAAGVKGAPVKGIRPESVVKGDRLQVDEFNRVVGYTNVFAIGDVAAMITPENPRGYPMVAQPAMQQGEQLAANFKRLLAHKELVPFKYNDKGSMATVGRNKAVADINKLRFGGFVAWVLWLVVHVMFIVGFRNRFSVFLDWLISYFTYDKSNRIIIARAGSSTAAAQQMDQPLPQGSERPKLV